MIQVSPSEHAMPFKQHTFIHGLRVFARRIGRKGSKKAGLPAIDG
ncbi:MAG: hypothetical protein AB8B86_07665 [Pseudomonadales bacterium]